MVNQLIQRKPWASWFGGPPSGRSWVPPFVGMVSLLVTCAVTVYVAVSSTARDRQRFEIQVHRMHDMMAERLETYVVLLRGTRGFLAATNSAGRDEFRRYVERLELRTRYPGVRGIGFSKLVPARDRDAVVAEMRQDEPNFRIWPEHEGQAAYPVMYLEPLDHRNQAAIGYDMFTDSVRRAAMERARDSGLPTASGKVTLRHDAGEHPQYGFLIYVPVYRGGRTPDTLAERRTAVEGFVFSPFLVAELLHGIFGPDAAPRLAFDIFDGTEPTAEDLLHRSHRSRAETDGSYRPSFTTRVTLDVQGRPWTIQFATRPAFELRSGKWLTPFVAAGGLLITLLLYLLTRSQQKARTVAEQTAADLRQSIAAGRLSAAYHGAILESSLDCIIATDSVGRITEFNTAAERTLGFARAEVLGKRLGEVIIPPGLRAAHRQGLDRYLHTGETVVLGKRIETIALRKDGTEIPVELAVTRIQLEGPAQFTAHLRDITERKLAENRLREKAQTLATLNQISASLAGELDLQKLVQDVTDAATQLVGAEIGALFYKSANAPRGSYEVQAVSGGPRADIVGPSAPPNSLLFAADFQSGATIRIDDLSKEDRFRARGMHFDLAVGSPPIRSYLAAPLVSRSGEIQGGLCFSHARPAQFTERHERIVAGIAAQAAIAMDNAQLYRSAQVARESAEAASRMKDEFLATLSHELRTPLNAILGWAELLREGTHDEVELMQGLERIERNALAQAQLISDLLDVSRIISGKMPLELVPVDLVDPIETAIDAVTPAAEAKGISIRKDLDPLAVRGDANRLLQVLWNLLSNAVKFTPAGGHVDVRLEAVDSQAEITVRDDGMGIGPEFLPYVFDRFRQLDSSTTRRHGGLGLGLAIVRHLVELHGGTVRAASTGPGRGASFVVSLPILVAQGPPVTGEPVGRSASAAAKANGGAADLKGLRILVVDDEADARELIQALLESYKAEVVAVGSAQAAIEVIEGFKPHVLISDIGMPEEDGYGLIRRIRALPLERGGNVPALALTAFARTEDRRRALLAGFQMYASKPVRRDDLVAMVASLGGRTVTEPPLANTA